MWCSQVCPTAETSQGTSDAKNEPKPRVYTELPDVQKISKRRLSSAPCKFQRRRWSEEEHKQLLNTFAKNITQKKMPRGTEIEALGKKLNNRTVAQIRTQVHNIITGKKKI